MTSPDILDDLFHGCAFSAYVQLAVVTGRPPDQEAARQLAYRFYEESLRDNDAPPPRSQD